MMAEHKRYAIVVGVSEYEADISPLPYAKNDAVRLASILTRHASFENVRTYLLANEPENPPGIVVSSPTRANILEKMDYVCREAGPDDLILVYFAGHGAEVSTVPYLLSCDTKMNILDKTALNVTEINDMLQKSEAKCILRFFDACRSPFAEARGGLGRMTAGFEEALSKTATGWASLCSCSSGEVAHESSEFSQGVFSYYLCEGLMGKAANKEAVITLESLVDYVKISVGNWCDRQTQKQTPHLQSDIAGTLVLTSLSRPTEKQEVAFANPFLELIAGLETHLASTAEDTRRLTFTSKEEYQAIADTLHARIVAKIEDLSHPALTTNVSAMHPLQILGAPSWPEFHRDMVSCEVNGEFTDNTSATKIDFISMEVIVPKTTLHVALIRFKFFYWIWYCHICDSDQLQGRFKPDPPHTKGFFTLKPTAAHEVSKIDEALSELFTRASREIVSWANQLGNYVESRVGPLRKLGPIIE